MTVHESQPAVPNPKRRWCQLSPSRLILGLLLTVAVAVPCSCLTTKMQQARRHEHAVAAMREFEAWIRYEHEMDQSGNPLYDAGPPEFDSLCRLLGEDFFADVAVVSVPGGRLSKKPIAMEVRDTDLVHLRAFQRLKELHLGGTEITDAGLAHIQGLNQLQWLILSDTHVTQADMQRIRRALPECFVSASWQTTQQSQDRPAQE